MSFASLYVAAGSTAQALTTSAAKLTGFTTAGAASSSAGDLSALVVAASDKLTLVGGRNYLVMVDIQFTHGDAAAQSLQVQLFLGGAAVAHAINKTHCTNAQTGTLTLNAIVSPAANTVADLEVHGLVSANMNVTLVNARLMAMSLG